MRKLFFTALVAVVAVGGAFATNLIEVSFSPYHTNENGCTDVTSLPKECGWGWEICTVNSYSLYDGSCINPTSNIVPFMPF